MKIVLGIIVAALLGIFTNLLSEKLSPKFNRKMRVIFLLFLFLIVFSIALAILPDDASAAKALEEYTGVLAFIAGATIATLIVALRAMRYTRRDWEKKGYIVLNWYSEFRILQDRKFQTIDKYTIEVLRDGFELFPCRYSWTGSEDGGAPSLGLPGQVLLGELTETGTGIAYYVKLHHPYRRGSIVYIHVLQDFTDIKNEMQPYFGVNVTRPVKQIKLKLEFLDGLPRVLEKVVSDGRINMSDVIETNNIPLLKDQLIYEWATEVHRGNGYAFIWRCT